MGEASTASERGTETGQSRINTEREGSSKYRGVASLHEPVVLVCLPFFAEVDGTSPRKE
jgi:hypothetical protein